MTDVDYLVIHDRQSHAATTYIAPADDIDYRDHVTERDTVADGDALIIEVTANGLYSILSEDNTASDLVEDSAFAQENGIFMHIEETEEPIIGNPEELDVSKADLVVEPDEERFLLVFDSATLDADPDNPYTVSFNMTEDQPYVFEDTPDQNLTTEFTIVESEVELGMNDDGLVELHETTLDEDDEANNWVADDETPLNSPSTRHSPPGRNSNPTSVVAVPHRSSPPTTS